MPSRRRHRRQGRCRSDATTPASAASTQRRREKAAIGQGCESATATKNDFPPARCHLSARTSLHGQALDRAVPTEVEMRNMKWLLAAGLIAATTAACTTDGGYYPNTLVQQRLLPKHRFQRVLPEHEPRLLFEQHRVQQQLLRGQPDPAARPQRRLRSRRHPQQVRPGRQRRRRPRSLSALAEPSDQRPPSDKNRAAGFCMPSTNRHYAAARPRSAAYCLSGRNHSPGNPFRRGQKQMRTVRWLVAAGLLASATGCVETNGYPGTSYGGYPSGYGGYQAAATANRPIPMLHRFEPYAAWRRVEVASDGVPPG